MLVRCHYTILIFLVITGCYDRSTAAKPNQRQQSVSPAGSYVLSVPIEANAAYYNAKVWKVTLSDANGGKLLYKDDDSHFVGSLNVYWMWDQQERVWLYNSDDGLVWFWEQQDGRWNKTRWGAGRTREVERDIAPPEQLYPHYVK